MILTNIQRILEKLHNEPLRDLLTRMYIEENETTENIALFLGVSRATVDRWIKEFNIHYRKPAWNKGLSKAEMQEIVQLKKQQ